VTDGENEGDDHDEVILETELRPNYSAELFGSIRLSSVVLFSRTSAELRYYSASLFCHVVARTTSCSHCNLALACVLHVQCLQVHGSAPAHNLQEVIQPVTEVTSLRRLRSSSSSALGKAPERLLSDLFKTVFQKRKFKCSTLSKCIIL